MSIDPLKYKNIPPFGLGVSLISACMQGHLEKVIFLLTSPELTTHADIHFNNDSPFKKAIQNKHMDILRFFIIDMNIEKTQTISNMLKSKSNKSIEKMFESRDLEKKLNNELNNEGKSNKKVKL